MIPVLTLLQLLLVFASAEGQSADQPLTKIAFGSCARERQEQPVWNEKKSPFRLAIRQLNLEALTHQVSLALFLCGQANVLGIRVERA